MPMEPNPSHRCWKAILSCAVLVSLSIAFVDRAASTWAHGALRGIAAFDHLTHIVDPLLPAAVAGLALVGIAVALGWKPGENLKTLLACCLAIVVAVALKEQLKVAFGRTWPETWVDRNPSWIGDGAYGFHPFHGGRGWTSFPSGHMTQITALAAVLWHRVRCLRLIWAALVLLVAVGLLGSDYHFVGDMIAGAYLGAASAAGILALVELPSALDAGAKPVK